MKLKYLKKLLRSVHNISCDNHNCCFNDCSECLYDGPTLHLDNDGVCIEFMTHEEYSLPKRSDK